jgi:hypothetical protein
MITTQLERNDRARRRAVKLLNLLTVGLSGRANERGAKAVRVYLEGHRGRPQLKQCPHDVKGNPSLFT